MRRVIHLPDRGQLIVATDVQGNAEDFSRVAAVFEQAAQDVDGAHLVVTGDLIHGPELTRTEWPEYLGSYYQGDSKGVLEHARELMTLYPGRVHYLLGNHEHAHIGGPVVSKFFPDEAQRLEDLLGEAATLALKEWLRTWPFIAVAPKARIVMLHAAPHAKLRSVQDLDAISLDMPFSTNFDEFSARGGLGALLWARTTSTERAFDLLHVVDENARVAVYGHDVARAGYAVDREPLLCLSTSFGCFDGDKLYLRWDLSEAAQSAASVASKGLRPLRPESPPVHRRLPLEDDVVFGPDPQR